LQRFIQNALQLAAFCKDALVTGREAFYEREIGLCYPNYTAEINLIGWLREAKAARAAPNTCQIAGMRPV
jgi:hypothetical protein